MFFFSVGSVGLGLVGGLFLQGWQYKSRSCWGCRGKVPSTPSASVEKWLQPTIQLFFWPLRHQGDENYPQGWCYSSWSSETSLGQALCREKHFPISTELYGCLRTLANLCLVLTKIPVSSPLPHSLQPHLNRALIDSSYTLVPEMQIT